MESDPIGALILVWLFLGIFTALGALGALSESKRVDLDPVALGVLATATGLLLPLTAVCVSIAGLYLAGTTAREALAEAKHERELREAKRRRELEAELDKELKKLEGDHD